MKRFYYLSFLGLMLVPNILLAQSKDKQDTQQQSDQPHEAMQNDYRSERLKNLSPRKKKKIADALSEKGSYYNAVTYYEEVYQKKKDDVHSVCQLAKLSYFLRDYKAAETWYKTLYQLDTAKYQKARYFIALMQKYNGNCAEANTNFKGFIDGYKNDDNSEKMEDLKKLVDTQMKGCDLAIQTLSKPEKVLIDLLDKTVNNPFTDFAPRPVGKDQLLFSSLRSDTAISVAASDTTGQKAHEFIAKMNGNTSTETKLFPAASNDINYHTGNGTLSPDGKRFYFTNCTPNEQLEMECEIFMNEMKNGSWGTPVKLGANINDGSNNTHPDVALVDGKEYLFFTSNRKGGQGGKDIWIAESDGKGDFGVAKNAGTKINTKYNEVTPFCDSKKNILYFSSDGLVSIGGFDIYKSERINGEYQEPTNLLAPINSSVDDEYFAVSETGKDGYLVSNRPGGYSLKSPTCCDDIYHYKIVTDIILKGYVATHKDPKTPLEGADVSFFIKDNGVNTPIANLTTHKDEYFMVPLDPEKVYEVNATKTGYWGSDTILDMPKINAKDTLEVIFYADEIERRKIQLKRIYYDFDKYNLTRSYKITLDSLSLILKDNPTWTIEIYGNADSIGTEDYNMVLSKKRAQAAADYLVQQGIDINRMSLIAKGETDPLVPNSKPNGKDDPDGRAKNRRVEFKLNSNDQKNPLDVEYLDEGPYKIAPAKGKK